MTNPSVTILNQRVQHFSMWEGELGVTVFRHMGLHGFPDALVVVRSPDSSIDTHQYNAGYHIDFNYEGLSMEQRVEQRTRLMDLWIESILLELASSSRGDVSEIVPGEEGYLFG